MLIPGPSQQIYDIYQPSFAGCRINLAPVNLVCSIGLAVASSGRPQGRRLTPNGDKGGDVKYYFCRSHFIVGPSQCGSFCLFLQCQLETVHIEGGTKTELLSTASQKGASLLLSVNCFQILINFQSFLSLTYSSVNLQ